MKQEKKKMQVTIVGNPSSGKSAFLSHILKTKDNDNQLKVNRLSTELLIMDRTYIIPII